MIMDDNIVLYDREAAVEYARTYALVYNKDYPNFDRGTPNSGDCMNFVSQCIHAGGMPQKEYGYLWFCNKKKHSSSWSGVDSFRNYLKKSFEIPAFYSMFMKLRKSWKKEILSLPVYPIRITSLVILIEILFTS